MNTIRNQIKEAERELSVRRRVCPQWVRAGRVDGIVLSLRRMEQERTGTQGLLFTPGSVGWRPA